MRVVLHTAALLAAALSSGVGAARLDMAEPTKAVDPAEEGWTPKPTGEVRLNELFRRQNNNEATILAAPDRTCGYVSGRPGAYYTCGGAALLCAFSIRSGSGAIACCNDQVCELRTQCVDYAAYSSGSCDNGCMVDIQVLKCTGTAMPYCNTVTLTNGVKDYWCNSLAISTAQTMDTTYSGGPARSYSRVTGSSSSAIRIATSGSVDANGRAASSEAPSSTESSGSSASSGSTNNGSSKDSGPPIGAIVGGVVGGVAAIAIAALAIFFFLRRKKKNSAAAAAAAATTAPNNQPPPQGPPPMVQQGVPPPSAYNSGVPAGYNGYYNPSQSTSPGPQYPQQQQPGQQGYYPVAPSTVTSGSPQTMYATDPRLAQNSTSPVPSFQQGGFPPHQPTSPLQQQQQQGPVYEAGGEAVPAHKTHELA